MTVPALEVRSLVKRYRTGWLARARSVLAGVDLALAPGDSFGLVGPNGSGKSTLLRILAGIELPDRGTIRVHGLDGNARAARRRLGYVPDGCPFPAELGARTVLELLGALYGLGRAARRAASEAWLERVGLAAEARTPLARFSLGMKRRFALAQALLHEPDVLLLDEPTAGLDAPGYGVLEALLAEARARGATLLMATHALDELEAHCTRAGVLVGGRLAYEGAAAPLCRDRQRLLTLYREHTPCSG